MLEQICAYIHNYFTGKNGMAYDARSGAFTIADGVLDLEGYAPGDYYLIEGSKRNDGVHRYGDELTDETFTGTICAMHVPAAFEELVAEIEAWNSKYGEAAATPYQSESFGGYSYTLKSGSTAGGQTSSAAATWRGVFASRLNQWRKLC